MRIELIKYHLTKNNELIINVKMWASIRFIRDLIIISISKLSNLQSLGRDLDYPNKLQKLFKKLIQ